MSRVYDYKAGMLYPYALPQLGANYGKHVYVHPDGINGSDGGPSTPVRTVTNALTLVPDNVPSVIHMFPGEYPETVTVNKRRVSLVGETGGRNPGIVAIVGTTTQTQATVRVAAGFGNGFLMEGITVQTGGAWGTDGSGIVNRATPCIELETVDANDYQNVLGSNYWFMLRNVVCRGVEGSTPSCGVRLKGAVGVGIDGLVVSACQIGVALTPSSSHNPTGVWAKDAKFFGNTQADVATGSPQSDLGVFGAGTNIPTLTQVIFENAKFMDRGGTPVTNYIAYGSGTTCVGVGFVDTRFARDVANGTLIATLPTDVFVLGHSPAGVESIVG